MGVRYLLPDDSGDSEVEEGVITFQADFERVVKQHDLRFDGDFAHGKLLPHAPNPCLHIEGLGTVGFPLNDIEGQRVFENCIKASYGPGTSSKIKHDEGAICDINATCVSFRGPVWQLFFNELVKSTCESLAASFPHSGPIWELRKLSLCWAGTPSYVTEKTGFATLVMLLPSCYTGGRVQVSHDGSTRTFDIAAHSATDICMLAWYNETKYTVDPITSGYQLALVYDIVPTSSVFPQLPVLQPAISELRKVLKKWSKGYYTDHSGLNLIAIVLTHKYEGEDLALKTLRGQDHYRASHIHPVAAEMGFVVGLAQLQYRNLGITDEDCGCECCSSRDRDDKDLAMCEVSFTSVKIDNMVDLTGLPIPGFASLKLSETNLILDNPFERQKPDGAKAHSYGDLRDAYSGPDCDIGDDVNLENEYLRSVLFLFHKNEEFSLLLASGNVSSALQKIRDNPSQEKTPENASVIAYMLKHARVQQHRNELSAVADYAVLWKDVDIWKRVVKKINRSRECTDDIGPFELLGKENVFKACSIFDFNDIQARLTTILDAGVTFQNQADLIKLLQTRSSEENVTKWCSERMSKILTSLRKMKLSRDDAPALLSIIADRGLAVLTDVILPQLSPQSGRDPDFDVWIALIQGLYVQKALIAGNSEEATQLSQKWDGNSLAHAIDLCSTTAMQQWQSCKSSAQLTCSVVIIQIGQLLDICITNGELEACTAIFRVIVSREKESPDSQFENVYRPLVSKLRELLRKHRTLDFWSYPFKDFMRFLIERCLHNLGLRPSSRPTMRRIGCGCHICGALDAFMLSDDTTTEFPGSRPQGQHLEQQISQASDIVTSSRIRLSANRKSKTFAVVVTKRTENPAYPLWKVRRNEAESFLSSIGRSDVIAKIMGPRVADVRRALDGDAAFAVDPSIVGMFRSSQSTTTAPTTTIAAKNTTLSACPTNSQEAPMLGTHAVSGSGSKRKRDCES